MFTRIATAALFCAALGGCMTQTAKSPAKLTSIDDANVTALKSALAKAVGRANIKLGAGELADATSVTVLPPPRGPHEMNSPAMPTHFEIVTDGQTCWLVQKDTGETFKAPGVSCATTGN